jgi:hypothetical protein
LQVLKDANGPLFARGDTTQTVDIAGVIFVRSVGKIEPGDVHAQTHEFEQHEFGVA